MGIGEIWKEWPLFRNENSQEKEFQYGYQGYSDLLFCSDFNEEDDLIENLIFGHEMIHSKLITATSAGFNLRILGDLLITDIREVINNPQSLQEFLPLLRNFYEDIKIYTKSMKYPLESYQVMRDYFYLFLEVRRQELAQRYLEKNLRKNEYFKATFDSLQNFCFKIEKAKPVNRAYKLLLVVYLALSVPILRYEDMTDSEDFKFYANEYVETSPKLRWFTLLDILMNMNEKQIINMSLNDLAISLILRSGLDVDEEFHRIVSYPAKSINLFIESELNVLKRGLPQFLETGIPDSISDLITPSMASFLFPNEFNLSPNSVDTIRKYAFYKRNQTPTSLLDILSRIWAFYHIASGIVMIKGNNFSVWSSKMTSEQNYLPYKLEGATGLKKRTQMILYFQSLTRNLLQGDFTCPVYDLLVFNNGEWVSWPNCDRCPFGSFCKNFEMER